MNGSFDGEIWLITYTSEKKNSGERKILVGIETDTDPFKAFMDNYERVVPSSIGQVYIEKIEYIGTDIILDKGLVYELE